MYRYCADYSFGKTGSFNIILRNLRKINLPLAEFERRPMEILQHLKELVGVAAFALLEQKINSSLKIVFEIKEDKTVGFTRMIELAEKSYLSAEM